MAEVNEQRQTIHLHLRLALKDEDSNLLIAIVPVLLSKFQVSTPHCYNIHYNVAIRASVDALCRDDTSEISSERR